MRRSRRFARFDVQVRVVLLLLVVFLGVVALMNVFLLGWADDALEASARQRATTSARLLAEGLGPAVAAEPAPPIAYLRRWARRTGFREIRIVDPRSGFSLTGSSARAREPALARLPPAARAGLSSGRPATLRPDGAAAKLGTYIVFEPVIGSDGALVAVLEATQENANLARLRRWIDRLRAIQIAGLAVVAAVAAAFASWVVRPYRTIAAAAGEAGLTDRGGGETEPDALAGAFRAMVARMREQDQAVRAVQTRTGGLGDLVRFAHGSGRSMSTGVLVLDRRRRVAAMNRAAMTMLAVDGSSTGRSIDDVAPSIPGFPALLSLCLEDGEPASREVLCVRWADGRTSHLGVTLSPSPGPDGRPVGALMLMTDLTEIRELQERSRVRENLAVVGEVSAGIAHEIRNALGTILANARIVEKRDDALVRGPARAIVKEVETVEQVVDEFLTYARPAPPRPTRFELRSVVIGAAAAAPEPVDVVVEGEFAVVRADRALVRRAFDNLLRNAAEIAGEGSRTVQVVVRGRLVTDRRWVQVEVEDNGPGIAEVDLEKVFVPFYTSRSRGTGLGLATVRRTMSDLGGSIEAARSSAGGALFRLRFPVASDEAELRSRPVEV